VVTALDS